MVDQMGAGFGGRSLLLSKQAPPELPYEVAVTVKLGDESGAAGLVFCADGKQKNYGFYPSAGGLRTSAAQLAAGRAPIAAPVPDPLRTETNPAAARVQAAIRLATGQSLALSMTLDLPD